jgi:acetyl esterase/lipase
VRNLVLLALVAALITGCATVHVVESSASIPLNSLLQEADANGVSTWAILPPSYNSKIPAPWIIYNHGSGQTIASIAANAPQSLFVQSLASAGFVVVASEYRNLACWGNEQCAEDVANVQTLWRSQLNLWPRPFVIGESMGGIVTWDAISHGTLNPLAVVGIYPVCNLAAMYADSGFAPTIRPPTASLRKRGMSRRPGDSTPSSSRP